MAGRAPAWQLALVLVAGLGTIAAGWWWAERRQQAGATDARAQALLAEFRKGLPSAYAPGLELEDVRLVDRDLVMTIRSQKRQVGDQPPGQSLAQVQRAEYALLLQLCDNTDVVYLLARGVTLRRRFIDAQDRLFFEVKVGADDCARLAQFSAGLNS